MKMYIYQTGPYDKQISLSVENIHHVRARRLSQGDALTLFDGLGLVAKAEITLFSRKEVLCQITSIEQREPVIAPRLVLGITKLPTIEFVLQKVTEVGVREIVLLQCDYTPIPFDQATFEKKKARWEKIIIAACEQSEQVYIPALSWTTFAAYMAENHKRYLFHVEGRLPTKVLDKTADIMIGPEGGWSDAEVAHNVEVVRLNTGILRTDTACLAALLCVKLS